MTNFARHDWAITPFSILCVLDSNDVCWPIGRQSHLNPPGDMTDADIMFLIAGA